MEDKPEQITIPYPDSKIFKYQNNIHTPAQSVVQPQAMFVLERVDYEDGILAYFKGCPFPQKGFPFPEALYAVNAIKRITIEGIKSIGKFDILPIIGFILTPKKYKIQSLEIKMKAYINGAGKFLDPYYLKPQYYSMFCKEMRKFMVALLTTYGIGMQIAEDFSDVFVTLVDYDNAYRLRAEDILSETTKGSLKNPAQELKRLIEIMYYRECEIGGEKTVPKKFDALFKILKYCLLNPSFRKAYKQAWEGMEIKNLQLDEADRHHVLLWSDYNFLGKPIDERIQMYIDFYGSEDKLPPRVMAQPV